jgi:hypothetical protein
VTIRAELVEHAGQRYLALIATCALLGACASQPHPLVPPGPTIDEFKLHAYTGKVSSRVSIPASTSIPYATPGLAFINGNVVRSYVNVPARQLLPAYFLYYVNVIGEPSRMVRVAAGGDFPDGACVSVMVKVPPPAEQESFPGGEAALLPSDACAR